MTGKIRKGEEVVIFGCDDRWDDRENQVHSHRKDACFL